MKGNKIILIIQTILMYLAQAPYTVALVVAFNFIDEEWAGDVIWPCILAGLIANVIILAIVIPSLILAILGIFKGIENPTKYTMIIKLSLIPWYIINFVLGFSLFAATLNPFLMWAFPLVAILMVFTTYVFMLTSNLQNYSYILNCLIRRKRRIDAYLVWSIILSFIFCLDIVSAIMLYEMMGKIEEGE